MILEQYSQPRDNPQDSQRRFLFNAERDLKSLRKIVKETKGG
ncbi:MAG: hypothetical protein WC322_02225 [Candidatus Paceibacterota bacterium]